MRSDDLDDCGLWLQFRNGDKEAYARLYQRFAIDLVCYGGKICNDPEMVKDAIQDLFVELWQSRENLSPAESIKFYLLRALRYKLIRAEKKRQQQNPLAVIYSKNTFNRFEVSVESAIIDKESRESQVNRLRKAVHSLTKRQQEVIQLRFYHGLSHEQIAQLMNMNYQSVSNLVYSALSSIRKNLKTPILATMLSAAICLISFF
jgi:RNA polymerase sigma-70 factor (ECF subfamily)